MVSIIQALIFSIVQGITEWLPISSSGHIAILENLFNFQSLSFVVFLQFASILAVIVLFWKDIIKVFSWKKEGNLKYFLMLMLAVVPAGLVGVLFKDQIAATFSNLFFLGIFFMISGIIIYSTKFTHHKREKLNWWDPIVIGLFQALAIFPGVSRSGSTISAGMYRGLKREQLVKFSFLLAIPTILGATVFEAKSIVLANINLSILAITFVVTFVISIFAIKTLLRIVRSDKFYWFGVYDFFVGIAVFIWSFFH